MAAVPSWSRPEIASHLSDLKDEIGVIFDRNTVSIAPNSVARLSHFTKQESLVKILSTYARERSKSPLPADHFLSLWLSDVSCLNDPLEGKALFSFIDYWSGQNGPKKWGKKSFPSEKWTALENIASWLQAAPPHGSTPRDGSVRRVLICSFTQDTDRIELWRAYGADGTGLSLSMPLWEAVYRLSNYSRPVSRLYHVRYSDEQKATAWLMLINHLEPLYELAAQLGSQDEKEHLRRAVIAECEQVFHLYKHEQYQNEHEIRLIRTYDLDTPTCFAGSGDYFAPGVRIDLDLNRVYAYSDPFFLGSKDSTIIIGPKVRDASRLSVTLSTFVTELWGINAPQVEASKAPYR